MNLKLKICGMKHNVAEIATLKPDYLGFIFYDNSPRNYEGPTIDLPTEIQKVGVFVNASMETIIRKLKDYKLDVIQLHGDETALFTEQLRKSLDQLGFHKTKLWKVFSVGDAFDFKRLAPYEAHVSAFLFDTKGVHRGGNGIPFNWDILQNYPSKKAFILSGGIGPEHTSLLNKLIRQDNLPIMAIDINSKFESEPGRKNVVALKKFMHELQCK